MNIIAFTGAGISKESGIATFEEQPGIRDKLTRQYANEHPDEYRQMIEDMEAQCMSCDPNDAHKALAEYNIPIITMNVDKLHTRAGSKHVLEVHGNFPDPVLYDDDAPLYQNALDMIADIQKPATLMIIGVSMHTQIANDLRTHAIWNNLLVVEINDNAATKVREYLEAT